jgi:hypothetical protein
MIFSLKIYFDKLRVRILIVLRKYFRLVLRGGRAKRDNKKIHTKNSLNNCKKAQNFISFHSNSLFGKTWAEFIIDRDIKILFYFFRAN